MKLKYFYINILIFLVCTTAWSQQNNFGWKLGVGAGFSNYYGDLSQYNLANNPWNLYQLNTQGNQKHEVSYTLSLERNLNNTVSFLMQYSNYEIQASDRYDWKGNLSPNHPNFSRALNFQSRIQDFSVGFVFSTDNGKMFKTNAFLSPYFLLTTGYSQFETRGDLYDNDGLPYNYSADGSLPNNGSTNGIFETDLASLQTEGKNYDQFTMNVGAGIGLKFRLSPRVSLNIESNFKYFFSDYVDDVSGNYPENFSSPEQLYASNPTGTVRDTRGSKKGNDWIAFHSLSLKYSFGKKRKNSYKVPVYRVNQQENDTISLRKINDLDKTNELKNQRNEKTKSEKTEPNIENKSGKTIITIERDAIKIETQSPEVEIKINDKNRKKLKRVSSQSIEILDEDQDENPFSKKLDSLHFQKNRSIENMKTSPFIKVDTLQNHVTQQKTNLKNSENINNEEVFVQKNNEKLAMENQKLQEDASQLRRQNLNAQKEISALKQQQNQLLKNYESLSNQNNRSLNPNNPPNMTIIVPPTKKNNDSQPENKNPENLNLQVHEVDKDSLNDEQNREQKPLNIGSSSNLAAGFNSHTENDSIKVNFQQNPEDNISLISKPTLVDEEDNEEVAKKEVEKNMEKNFEKEANKSIRTPINSDILPSVELFFDMGSVKLNPKQEEKLESVFKILQEYPEIHLVITGKADAVGNPERNLEISQIRAQEVQSILEKKHLIEPQRMAVFAFGQKSSTGKNALDRKVTIEFTKP